MTVFVPNTNISNTYDFMRRRINHLANAMSYNAVTVNSNAAIGDAEVIGTFRANTVYADFLRGGNSSVAGLLTVSTNTFINSVLTVSNNATFSQTAFANLFSSNSVTTNLVTVGAATLTSNVMTVNAYVGNWTGNTIPINRGGTGVTTLPAKGNILIGDGSNNYVVGSVVGEPFVSVSTGANGFISIKNLGVTKFGSNTTNMRSGNVTLTSADVTQALGFIPGSANAQLWIQVGSDLQYYGGNVAIGQVMDGAAASNATLAVLSTDASKPIGFFTNGNTASNTQSAMINLGVANTGARMGIGFIRGANSANVVGGITYNGSDTLAFRTNGLENVFIDSNGNIGIGTGSPTPNKGGGGLHIISANPGLTLQSPTQTWHMGVNPNSVAYYGGVRSVDSFGIFSDNSNSAAVFTAANTTSTAAFAIALNNVGRLTIAADGNNLFAGPVRSDSDMYSTGFQTTSDYREKYDVATLTLDTAVECIKGLRPVSFKYNNTTRLREGFIAHELQEFIPVAVTGVKDGVVKQTVDKSEVVPTLVAAVQALINRVEQLETKLREVSA
jgi:hypothetical protein